MAFDFNISPISILYGFLITYRSLLDAKTIFTWAHKPQVAFIEYTAISQTKCSNKKEVRTAGMRKCRQWEHYHHYFLRECHASTPIFE
jgi:hypothetical protein